MIQIENKQRGPVQLVVKSKNRLRAMSVVNIPGIGSGNNFYYLEDELTTEFVERLEKIKWIKTKYIPDREFKKK